MSASILIADDEPGIRDLLCWELSGHGHDVTAAVDGADALAQMRQTEFDLLISDVRMPRVGGLEVLRASKETAPDTEVIIATGHAELEYAIECVRQGAFDFVQKPFQTEELLATVLRALERRRLRRTAGLYETSRAILDGQEPQRLPELIVRLAMEAMNADDASLMLPDADGTLCLAHSHSLSPEVQGDVRLRVGERIAGRVALLGEPALIPDAIADDPRFRDLISSGRVRSSIVYPLLSGKRVAGVLCINRLSGSSSRPFRKPDLERAAILASQALLALENARLIRHVASSERLASVGLLAAGVAHEINSPAACVLANHDYLEEQLVALGKLGSLLESGADAAALRRSWASFGGTAFLSELQQALGDLGAGASAIRDIARDMKSLARNDDAKPIMFDLNDAIRSAVRVAGAQVRLVAVVRMDLAADLEILGSPGRVSQVFVNLLVNAAQALAEKRDGRRHEINIRSWREGDKVIASVTDDGPGIRAELAARIFDPFFTTKGATVGTGLGLAITREIVVGHGGDLRVDSTQGCGATFTMTLPFAGTVAHQPTVIAPAQPDPNTAGAVTKGFRILFVDDERIILKSYERAFARNHDVVVAEGGEQALATLAAQWNFDLIVCDLLMPDINGMEVFHRAREAHPELDGRFVFVTGGVTMHEVQTFLRNAGNQVLEKPFDFSAVREIIAARSARVGRGSEADTGRTQMFSCGDSHKL